MLRSLSIICGIKYAYTAVDAVYNNNALPDNNSNIILLTIVSNDIYFAMFRIKEWSANIVALNEIKSYSIPTHIFNTYQLRSFDFVCSISFVRFRSSRQLRMCYCRNLHAIV